MTAIDVSVGGKTIKRGLQLWHLDSHYFKSFLYARLNPPEGEPDMWHLPHDVTDDYCKQVTAEAPVIKPSGQPVWVRNRKDNHYLDCEYMQIAGAHMLRIHAMEAPVSNDDQPPSPAPERKRQEQQPSRFARRGF